MEKLKSEDLGRAGMLLGPRPGRRARRRRLARPARLRHVCDRRRRRPRSRCTARCGELLFKVAVVDDLERAKKLVAQASDVTAVTRDGDVLGPHFAAGGSASTPA